MTPPVRRPASRRQVMAGLGAAVAAPAVVTLTGPEASAQAAPAGPAPSVVVPGSPRYDDLRVANNARWVAEPDAIVLVGDGRQVPDLVQRAVASGKRLSVRSGGHCYTDFVLNPDVDTVLDVSRLEDVAWDPQLGAFAVEPGGVLLEIYKKLYRGWGVTIPGGMCYSVGTGGHVVGGGYGLLSRRHGSTVDHLHAVEVVCVDARGKARAIRATSDPKDPHHDLWWAHTGGGGGNFGVITKYWFRSPGHSGRTPEDTLIAPPRSVLVSALGIPWDSLDETRFAHLVRQFGRWHEENAGTARPAADLCSFLMMNHRSNGALGLLTVIDADAPDARGTIERFVTRLLGAAGVERRELTDAVGEVGPMPGFVEPKLLPWLHSMSLLGTNNPTLTSPVLRGDHKSAYLKTGFTDTQIAAIHRNLTRTDHANPQSMVVLLSYGGQINERPSGATAAAQRSSLFKGLFQSFWEGAENDAANIAWTRDVYTEVFAGTGGYPVPGPQTDGCYINYPDADIRDPAVNRSGVPWSRLYYGDNYARLLRVKRKYDPLDVFHHSQSVGS